VLRALTQKKTVAETIVENNETKKLGGSIASSATLVEVRSDQNLVQNLAVV